MFIEFSLVACEAVSTHLVNYDLSDAACIPSRLQEDRQSQAHLLTHAHFSRATACSSIRGRHHTSHPRG
jgi:hypothetical protein